MSRLQRPACLWGSVVRQYGVVVLLGSVVMLMACARLNQMAGTSVNTAVQFGTVGSGVASAPGAAVGLALGAVVGAGLGLVTQIPESGRSPAEPVDFTREDLAKMLKEQHPNDPAYTPSANELDRVMAERERNRWSR